MRVLVVEETTTPTELMEKIEAAAPERVELGAEALKAILAALALANQRLEERKLVERAKGLLMKARGLDEESAYRALRKMAMDRSLKLGEAARRVLDAWDLLGA